jgi:flavin reductase (DIM6/NTAB) family NADH-FMN oxidoreductase RutF
MSDPHSPIIKVLDLVDRAVWVVTAAAGGARSGLLATWVMQSSLDPATPKLSLSLNSQNFTTQLIGQSGFLGLHLLRPDQTDLAWGFGLRSGRETDKFAEVKMTLGVTGAPVLADCLASLECRVLRKVEIGDRLCIWSAAVASKSSSTKEQPLGEHALLATATSEQQIVLRSRMQQDIARERLAWQAILSESPEMTGG